MRLVHDMLFVIDGGKPAEGQTAAAGTYETLEAGAVVELVDPDLLQPADHDAFDRWRRRLTDEDRELPAIDRRRPVVFSWGRRARFALIGADVVEHRGRA